MTNTRTNEDGFRGEYPAMTTDWEAIYREHGVEPPWTLEWKNGHIVEPGTPSGESVSDGKNDR